MKKSELIKWLELYNDDLPVTVDTSEGLFEPTAMKKAGNVLVLYNTYDLTGEELMYHNVTNAIVANKESSDNKQVEDMTHFLPNDIARCNRDDCPLHLECARWLDVLPMDAYWYSQFEPKGCEYFIEKKKIESKKKKI